MIRLDSQSSKKNINKLINAEIVSIKASLSTQKNLNKQILIFIKNFTENIDIETDVKITNEIYDSISDATLNLKKINFNIASLEELLEILSSIKANIALDNQAIITKVEEFNIKYTDLINKIFINNTNIQNFIHSISFLDLSVDSYNTRKIENVENIKIIEHSEINADNVNNAKNSKTKKNRKIKSKNKK